MSSKFARKRINCSEGSSADFTCSQQLKPSEFAKLAKYSPTSPAQADGCYQLQMKYGNDVGNSSNSEQPEKWLKISNTYSLNNQISEDSETDISCEPLMKCSVVYDSIEGGDGSFSPSPNSSKNKTVFLEQRQIPLAKGSELQILQNSTIDLHRIDNEGETEAAGSMFSEIDNSGKSRRNVGEGVKSAELASLYDELYGVLFEANMLNNEHKGGMRHMSREELIQEGISGIKLLSSSFADKAKEFDILMKQTKRQREIISNFEREDRAKESLEDLSGHNLILSKISEETDKIFAGVSQRWENLRDKIFAEGTLTTDTDSDVEILN